MKHDADVLFIHPNIFDAYSRCYVAWNPLNWPPDTAHANRRHIESGRNWQLRPPVVPRGLPKHVYVTQPRWARYTHIWCKSLYSIAYFFTCDFADIFIRRGAALVIGNIIDAKIVIICESILTGFWKRDIPWIPSRVSQRPPLPTLYKISLPVYVIVTNKRLQPLITTWCNSLLLSLSLLKI